MDTIERLADAIGDLRRRLDAAGRDYAAVDITFTNFAGGNPGEPGFNADAYLTGLADLAALGVTWVQVVVPGDSVAHALETIESFGGQVIDNLTGSSGWC